MDDQNNNPGADAGVVTPQPTSDVPMENTDSSAGTPAADSGQSASEPQADEKCATCQMAASGGNCVACGQGEVSCTCQPDAGGMGSGGGMGQGGETSPAL